MSTFLYDIPYALRQLQKNPGSIAVAVLTLALGVCSSVAIFAFVDAGRTSIKFSATLLCTRTTAS